jgi:hypothetical protein
VSSLPPHPALSPRRGRKLGRVELDRTLVEIRMGAKAKERSRCAGLARGRRKRESKPGVHQPPGGLPTFSLSSGRGRGEGETCVRSKTALEAAHFFGTVATIVWPVALGGNDTRTTFGLGSPESPAPAMPALPLGGRGGGMSAAGFGPEGFLFIAVLRYRTCFDEIGDPPVWIGDEDLRGTGWCSPRDFVPRVETMRVLQPLRS